MLAVPLLIAAVIVLGLPLGSSQWMPWIPSLGVGIALRLDGLSLLFAVLVLVIGAVVLCYSARYLNKRGSPSFYLTMTAFAASMSVLVLADDLVLLFVAWEATTLCSFFLIAQSGPAARAPAVRTLLVTVAGGLSLLAAVATMAITTGTTRLSDVLIDPVWQERPALTATVAVLLVGAVFTKSAQIPFQSWLPDSMVAITPVSAYLHAAAMVKAGIYLALRFAPAMNSTPVWSTLLIIGGVATALFGAFAALRRHDLKELLAYSTMSQLGLLITLIGVGTPLALTAAVVHTVAHALFKSALFMLVGVVDHRAGTRDIRQLAGIRLRMPATIAATGFAAASMAGLPLLLGFISKEAMFTALWSAPGPRWLGPVLTGGAALTSALTIAYSGRLVLALVGGRREGRVVREASWLFWTPPALCALAGLVLGVAPGLLDAPASAAASASASFPLEVRLELWHGVTVPLAVSAVVVFCGVSLILARRRVEAVAAPMAFPWSGIAVIDGLRTAVIQIGAAVGGWTSTFSPARHLAVPVLGLMALTVAGAATIDDLPAVVGAPSRPIDWVLVALIAVGVLATVRARTRVASVVVVGIVGFTMTLWFFALGATDVALTQLLIEILTISVMVLLLRRLPHRFTADTTRRRIPAAALAIAAGAATALGTWALTGRRDLSPAADYFLRHGADATGGANLVNTILVDFRALDTLGELTVLGVAGLATAALLQSRPLSPDRPTNLNVQSPLADARANAVFLQSTTKALGPVVILISLILLLRGHNEPGGGFIAALVGGAGVALMYLAAPSDAEARIRWPHLTLIGAGVTVGVTVGFLGYSHGSFLTPMHFDIAGLPVTTALIFDIGVYLAVIGVILTSFDLLGRSSPDPPSVTGVSPPDEPSTCDYPTVEVTTR
ncbi:DUF4040 family protein [Dietzia aurantiaca]